MPGLAQKGLPTLVKEVVMKEEGQQVLKAEDAALIQPIKDEDPDNPLLSIIN